jgi:hypothetical protein
MKPLNVKLLLLLIIVLGLNSCKTVMMKYYGASNPKLETNSTVEKYLHKKNIDTTNLYMLKNFKSFLAFSNNVMTPNGFFYNRNGYYVDYNQTPKQCNANVGQFILDLKNINQGEKDTKNLREVINFICDKSGNTVHFEEGYDVYVLISWAKYVGKLNDEKAFEWVDIIAKTNFEGLKVKYYLVNVDLYNSWPDLPKDHGLKKAK